MLTLRKMTKEDVPLYLRWLKAPHVAEWVDSEPAKIYRKFDDPIYKELLIACWDGEPVAYVQVYDAATESGDHPVGVLGMDLWIGEEGLIEKGLGTQIVSKVANRLIADPDVPYIVIDPKVTNARAIRCYEKVGFRPMKKIITREGECLLMKLEKPQQG